ncbi:MAG TPA: hypothetical protein VJ547_08395 [Candidatus Thermoplasmatota archaeon]|nr:hypothetical protein [Candidatus Thermoplasmatota archaeon]
MAKEFMGVAKDCAGRGLWRAAGLNAVHAAISAADAVCVLRLHERATGEQHDEAADLLGLSGAPDARDKALQFAAILDLKSRIAYEVRPPSKGECEVLVRRATRFVEWAVAVVEA